MAGKKGGIFTWVKGSLGDKTGWTAMFYQWIHITVGMDTMMYVIIGGIVYHIWDTLVQHHANRTLHFNDGYSVGSNSDSGNWC